MKIKHIYFIVLIASTLSSCSLDVPILDKISGYDAIDSPETAREALNGAYAKYPKSIFLELALLSEDFFITDVSDPLKDDSYKLYNWNHETIKNNAEVLWNTYYDALKQLNIVLAAEKNMPEDDEDWLTIKGETHALKAMIYYDLLQVFSDRYNDNKPGVILRNEYESKPQKRTNIKESIDEILKNISLAETLLKDKKKKNYYYLDYNSCLVLKARTLLYSKKYDEIPAICKVVLKENSYQNNTKNKAAYENLWQSQSSISSGFSEKMFAFDNQEMSHPMDPFWVNEKLGDIIAVNPAFDYQDEDIRKGIATFAFKTKLDGGTTIERNFIGKYRKNMEDRTFHNINLIRLAEVYFILAESYLELGQDTEALNVLNEFLTARGADLISQSTDKNKLREKLYLEKQKEFVGEGLNFVDLKRWGKNVLRFQKSKPQNVARIIQKTDYRFTFPISRQEIRHSEGLAEQNNGWTNIY